MGLINIVTTSVRYTSFGNGEGEGGQHTSKNRKLWDVNASLKQFFNVINRIRLDYGGLPQFMAWSQDIRTFSLTLTPRMQRHTASLTRSTKLSYKQLCDSETRVVSLEQSNINVRKVWDTWTFMLAPCQPGLQEEGDSASTNTHNHTEATICASQFPVSQKGSPSVFWLLPYSVNYLYCGSPQSKLPHNKYLFIASAKHLLAPSLTGHTHTLTFTQFEVIECEPETLFVVLHGGCTSILIWMDLQGK